MAIPESDGASTPRLLTAAAIGRRNPRGQGWLIRQIHLQLVAGERLSLVGPTGSGKSLVLRSLAQLDPLDEGEVLWRGRAIADGAVPEFRSRVVYLQQRSPLIAGSVEENLKMPFGLRRRRDVSFPEARAGELLERLGRESSFLSQSTANLSGGERQIVALVRALLIDPEVLLLDEPSAALDPQSTAALERLIETWYAEAPVERAYIWVSHDPAQAERVSQRVVRLRQGTVEAD